MDSVLQVQAFSFFFALPGHMTYKSEATRYSKIIALQFSSADFFSIEIQLCIYQNLEANRCGHLPE